jgi:hypothetical protein
MAVWQHKHALLFSPQSQLQSEVEKIALLIELDFWAIAHQRRASLHDQSNVQQARELLAPIYGVRRLALAICIGAGGPENFNGYKLARECQAGAG